MAKKIKPSAPGEEVDAGALVARLRDAFRGNDPADWIHAAETLREVDEEVRRIIDAGDMRALPGAMLALGFMLSMHDIRTGARAMGRRTGGQRKKSKVDDAAIVARLEEKHGGRLPERAKRGSVQGVATEFEVTTRYVKKLARAKRLAEAKKKEERRT